MSPWTRIGRLTKAKGKKGDLVAVAAPGLPFLFASGLHVWFVPPQLDVAREGRVTSAVSQGLSQGQEAGIVTFDTVGSREEAAALEGCWCLAAKDDLPKHVLAQAQEDLEGYEVRDEALGAIGVIAGFIDNPAQSLARIATMEGAEVLMPWVEAFVLAIDDDARVISVSLPQGILEL